MSASAAAGAVRVAVVGGGIAGLVAADRVGAALGRGAVALLEADARVGGKIRTERHGDYLLETGPDCFLAAKPGGLALCRHLGLDGHLQELRPGGRRSFVRRRGRLHPLPEGITGMVPARLGPLLTTRILSPIGRLRAALEPLVPRRAAGDDESVAGFVTRRFGREAYRWLLEPMLSGIYAGDGATLSLAATFPQLRAREAERGSVLWPLLRGAGAGNGGGAPRGFVTLSGGLGMLVEACEQRLAPERVWRNTRVAALAPGPDGYRIMTRDGRHLDAEAVILAVPAFEAAALFRDADAPLADLLDATPFVSTLTVSVALPAAAVPRPLAGAGYLSPRAEGGHIVACTWTSAKFGGRAPEGAMLWRFFLGRAGMDDIAKWPDETVRDVVRAELAAIHGVHTEPALWRIQRWPRGLPQYTIGHRDRLARIGERLRAWPRVSLAGASYLGVGIPDCIAGGWAAADAAVAAVRASVA